MKPSTNGKNSVTSKNTETKIQMKRQVNKVIKMGLSLSQRNKENSILDVKTKYASNKTQWEKTRKILKTRKH